VPKSLLSLALLSFIPFGEINKFKSNINKTGVKIEFEKFNDKKNQLSCVGDFVDSIGTVC
jgi:hypothetical protein